MFTGNRELSSEECRAKVEVVAAVLKRNGRFLVCQRPPHKRHGNLREFPGGKLQPGESFLDAARRELLEELGLKVTSIGLIRCSVLDPGSQFSVNFVDVEFTGDPIPTEHIACQWLATENLIALALAPADRIFVEHLIDGLFDKVRH